MVNHPSKRNIYYKWRLTVTIGEFVGFVIPSIAGVITVVMQIPQFPQTLLLVLAGIGEGLVLGYAQSRLITKHFKKIKATHWTLTTAFGAGIAWIIGMLPSTFFDYINNIPLPVILPIAVILGSILLLSIGYMQYLLLKKHVLNAHIWIWGNILAWVAGLTTLFIFMGIAPNDPVWILTFSILGGFGMAAVMSSITGFFFVKLKLKKTL